MKIEAILVHHSASRFGCVRIIDEWHRARGWRMIGYHAVIGNGRPFRAGEYLPAYDGIVEVGRSHNFDTVIEPEERGAHAAALGMNARSLGVCLIGRKLGDYTPAQLRALVDWLRVVSGNMKHHHGLTPDIKGHKEIDARKPVDPDLSMTRLRLLVAEGTDHRIFSDRDLKDFLQP